MRTPAPGGCAIPGLRPHRSPQEQGRRSHRSKGGAPAMRGRDGAANSDTQNLASDPACHEGAGQRGTQSLGEDGDDHRNTDAAVSSFADTDEDACRKHLIVTASKPANQRGRTPQCAHRDDAFHSAEAIRKERDRASQDANHQRHDAGEKAELTVRQVPFRLQQWEDSVQHLPRHIVGDQQAEG